MDDEDLIADLLDDKQIILERLSRLKSRGIIINQAKDVQKSTVSDQTCPDDMTFNTQEFLEHLNDEAAQNDENERIDNVSL